MKSKEEQEYRNYRNTIKRLKLLNKTLFVCLLVFLGMCLIQGYDEKYEFIL